MFQFPSFQDLEFPSYQVSVPMLLSKFQLFDLENPAFYQVLEEFLPSFDSYAVSKSLKIPSQFFLGFPSLSTKFCPTTCRISNEQLFNALFCFKNQDF